MVDIRYIIECICLKKKAVAALPNVVDSETVDIVDPDMSNFLDDVLLIVKMYVNDAK